MCTFITGTARLSLERCRARCTAPLGRALRPAVSTLLGVRARASFFCQYYESTVKLKTNHFHRRNQWVVHEHDGGSKEQDLPNLADVNKSGKFRGGPIIWTYKSDIGESRRPWRCALKSPIVRCIYAMVSRNLNDRTNHTIPNYAYTL